MKEALILLLLACNGLIYAQDITDLKGDYFGQIPPGKTPEVFTAPLYDSEKFEIHSGLSFSPDLKELYYSLYPLEVRGASHIIMSTKKLNNEGWTTPEIVSFSGRFSDDGPFITPNGNRLYYCSNRPLDGQGEPYPMLGWEDHNIWFVERTDSGWSTPMLTGLTFNTNQMEIYPSASSSGNIYYGGHVANSQFKMGLKVSYYQNGQYAAPIVLADGINSSSMDWCSFIAPDESYLIFSSNRIGNDDWGDLFITFLQSNDKWSAPLSMGPVINTSQQERFPSITPDGKYLFFVRHATLHWVSANIIDDIKKTVLPDPNGPIQNTATDQRFSSIQCAVDYANPRETIVIEPGIYEESFTLDQDITLQSLDPNDPNTTAATIIRGDGQEPVLTVENTTIDCQIMGLTLQAGSAGLCCDDAHPIIRNCQIVENVGPGVELLNQSQPVMRNCIVAANQGYGVAITSTPSREGIYPSFINCTITQNSEGGMLLPSGRGCPGSVELRNCIVYFNGADTDSEQLPDCGSVVTYSCVQGGFTGAGNIAFDPCFAALGDWEDPNDSNSIEPIWRVGDYHLQSQSGRWQDTDPNPNTHGWVRDALTSPCIDSGDPQDAIGVEPNDHGGRINMGAYGGTSQASRSGTIAFQETGQSFGLYSSWYPVTADLDGDGDLDLLYRDHLTQGGAYRVWLNQGAGLFGGPSEPICYASGPATTGDLDGDHDIDLFIDEKILWNDGTGHFTSTETPAIAASSTGLSLSDLDGDGDLDIVSTAYWENLCSVWMNDGTGRFSDSGQRFNIPGAHRPVLGDLDGDGDTDALICANAPNDTSLGGSPDHVLLNDGTGRFTDSGQRLGDNLQSFGALGDIDNDGDLDAVIAMYHHPSMGTTQPDKIYINDGTGFFTESEQDFGLYIHSDVLLQDFDLDGDLDIFFTGTHQGCHFWINNGAGRFRPGPWDPSSYTCPYAAAGDLDQDGDVDLFLAQFSWTAANYGKENVMLLNQALP
jgi:Tol biopolymer transport system component